MKPSISPEPALLGFLRQGPLHGYDLHKQVVANLGAVWRLGQSQMYAILKEYETRGWIKTVVTPQPDRPARKMLQLTPAGKRAFDAWMNQSAHGLREFRVDFFARLYFARAAGRPALRAFLNQQIKATQDEYNKLRAAEPDSEFARVVSNFRQAQLQAILDWLTVYQTNAATPPPRRLKNKVKHKLK
ncbi:MAG: PadR family transcriptional regulator [Anaerolineae bacterium]|nr:PadR family transcriptional regulator [Anaerolineae bacterium]